MFKTLIMSGLVFMLGACATMERFNASMDSYLGMDLQELQQQFGYNFTERTLDDGLRAFTWVRVDRGTYPGYHMPGHIRSYQTKDGHDHVYITPGYHYPSEYYEKVCEFSFVIDDKNKAVSWRAHGNGCRGYSVRSRIYGSGRLSL